MTQKISSPDCANTNTCVSDCESGPEVMHTQYKGDQSLIVNGHSMGPKSNGYVALDLSKVRELMNKMHVTAENANHTS